MEIPGYDWTRKGEQSYTERIIVVLTLFVAAAPFLSVSIPPMTDLCQHVLVAHVLSHFHDGMLQYSKFFDLDLSPRPCLLFYFLLALLDLIVGPFAAAKFYLVGYVVALWSAEWYFLRKSGHDAPALVALAALPLALSWFVYMGFLPFIGTFPLYALLLGWWLGTGTGPRRVFVGCLILLVLYGFHLVGAVVGAFSIGVISLLRWMTGRFTRKQMLLDLSAILPLVLLFLAYAFRPGRPAVSFPYYGMIHQIKAMIGYNCFSLANAATWCSLGGFAALAVGALFVWYRKRERMELAVLVVLLCVIGLLMPVSLGGWWPAGPRVVPFAVLAVLGTLKLERVGVRVLVALVLLILSSESLLTVRQSRAIDREYAVFLSGIPAVPLGSKILPIVIDPLVGGHISPFWSIFAAYTIERGGSNPYVFAAPYIRTGASPLRYRADQSYGFSFLYNPTVEAKYYRGVSSNYDFVLMWGKSPTVASVLQLEMSDWFRNPPLQIFRSDHRIGDNPPPASP